MNRYEPLEKHLQLVDSRNSALVTKEVMGINIDKFFMPSVANVIGTDLSKYKLISKGKFACNPMHVGRDERLPVALYDKEKSALVSPAYFVFEIKNRDVLNEEYLMMWFKRPEFDRNCWLMTDGSVRGGITWEALCRLEVPILPIEEQFELVRKYRIITERIELKKKINDNLVESLRAIFHNMFKNKDYPFHPLSSVCSKIGSGATPKGGKESYCDTGISLIRSMNVFDFRFSYSELAHINEIQADALSNVVVSSDDVLFNITGVSVARCCMVPPDVLPARVNQHVMILRPIAGKYMSYYLMTSLCDADNKAKLLGIGQSGSTREAINKQEMESFTIPVPPEDEVNHFGCIAETLYLQINKNNAEIMQMNDLQKLLLSKLSSR